MEIMRKTILLAPLLAIGLSGCGTGGVTPATLPADLTAIEQTVQGFARGICGFVPDLATVAGIINALYPAASVATIPAQAIASTICNTVPPAPATPAAAAKLSAKLRAGAPIVYPGTNIVIHGKYVPQ